MTANGIGEWWNRVLETVGPFMDQIRLLAGRIGQDPFLLGAVAVVAMLIVWLLFLVLRRAPGPDQPETGEYLKGEDSKQKRQVVKAIERTLGELEREDPQFVSLMRTILKYCPLEQLLSHDEIEVAFGRLSFLQEKRRKAPRKRSSLLAPVEGAYEARERHAAMLTVVRGCYASDSIYPSLDESARGLVDRFLDSVSYP